MQRTVGSSTTRPVAADTGAWPIPRQPRTAGRPFVLHPHGLHDLRRSPAATGPAVLSYPFGDLVVVTGLPGSGKSTLMRRCARAPIVDSQLSREHYARLLPPGLPYAVYRPLVRLRHYRRLHRALLAGGPLVVHDCGTLPWVRAWLARTALSQGRRLHLVLLDSTPAEARQGQQARGRRVSAYAFARHRGSAARLHAELAGGSGAAAGCASTVLLDRAAARGLRGIEFTAGAPGHLGG
ncbi:AAA family ATPase [Kitasatospora sp. NPDC056138]|uniref:AAA family ATPase n=1 Tax=Kitasatospora sp. NPDC056138 TaxID=3345724 RepID=UPI0035D6EE1E